MDLQLFHLEKLGVTVIKLFSNIDGWSKSAIIFDYWNLLRYSNINKQGQHNVSYSVPLKGYKVRLLGKIVKKNTIA